MRDDPFSPAVRLLGWAVHGTFLVLLAIAAVQVLNDGLYAAAAGGLALGALYVAGVTFGHWRTSAAQGRGWLVLLTLAWITLALASPDFVWLAFPLFFVYHHLLPLPVALPGVVLMTAAAVATIGWHTHTLTLAQVLGPSIGAAVATLMSMAYRALYRESEARRRLIGDLVSTRERLVRAEGDAARLAERERLAREIHDTLAQGMSSIILLLRAVRRDLDTDRAAADARLLEAEEAAAENLEEARGFVRALAPPALRGSSLADALRRVTESAAARTPTRVRFEVSGTPVALPIGHDVALLRIAQGALGNVARHSGAGNAGVTLTFLDDLVVLDVYDDGCGFDPRGAPGSDGTGFGLRAMRERARAVGGTLTVESAPGEGTAVAATLPLPDETPPPGGTPPPDGDPLPEEAT
ncbi:sensor histidine kinase [Spirillospora sp. NBC_01491]|uniref:sensor histidine kinase n=1 Tax=Spirillospora sp. NBC_01491 TaxID=2976007 RepID=UPI002E323A8A|nr:sensor histidine kinase [Spirillospora sp. NBC_01491]